ncbi:hypothetical protein [Streptomyces sp. I05A-00742]|uniref:hypothetical protein n=1 Tax=Streptomyces sp. I05A-00742 TaxID=2732853 RepID=UPI00148890A6|nr:hypothetical protein [Streptomyces sp. I05A-00742]
MSLKSCYELEFRVAPGGSRKDTHYVRGTLDEIKADLADELAEAINLYLLCWYGADLTLHVYQHDELARSIDLHPFLTIAVDGYPEITFTGPGEPAGYDFAADEDVDDPSATLSGRMFCDELGDGVSCAVDWDRAGVPPLAGDVATAGDATASMTVGLPYGHSDGEL